MNRRDFSRLSGFALAASRLPAVALAQPQTHPHGAKPIGYAAIGLGSISDLFIQACASSRNSRITALVTGHPADKGARYAAQCGLPASSVYTYETFDRILDNKDVDAVYIGLPNSMHCEFTLRAAKAGKHVLCEKPMAISSAECRTMIDACRAANVKLMIAYRIHYDPTWTAALQKIKAGDIGDIESFQGGFYGQPSAGAWRLSRTLGGGGSVMDLGIYPLNTIRYLTGEEPQDITAVVATRDHSGRFAEVEQSVQWTMKFPSGILASCGSSYGSSGPSFLMINGSKGRLQMDSAFNYEGLHLTGRAGKEPIDLPGTGKVPFQFTLEADHFSDCIRLGHEPRTPGEEGLKDLLAIESIYKSAGAPIA
jgi:predicted dehydrogenase